MLELMQLDQLGMAFAGKALDREVASGVLLVKMAERGATLLGLARPCDQRHSAPADQQVTSTDRIESALNAFLEEDRRNDLSAAH